MHLVVSSKDFADALTPHLQIVPKRSPLPILQSLLWEMEDEGKLKISSTDLEVSLTTITGVSIGGLFQTGEKHHTTVPAIKMFEIMKALSHDEVHIETQNTRMSIKAGKGDYRIATAPPEDFPALDFDKETQNLEAPLAQLAQAIKRVLFAISKDESRPILNGVHLQSTSEESGTYLALAATDGHRLAQVKNIELQNPNNSDQPISAIIPEKALKFISRFWYTDNPDATTVIHYGEKYIKFVCGDEVLTTRIIEGKFPPVEKVIPKSPPNVLAIDREQFLKSVKRVALLSNADSRQIKITLETEHILISTCDTARGSEAEERLSINYNGDLITLGFNAQYLMDNLRALDADEIIMKFTDKNGATITRPTDNENVLMLLMPVRLAD